MLKRLRSTATQTKAQQSTLRARRGSQQLPAYSFDGARNPTCGNWKDRISALAQSTGRGTFLIDPECQDILWLDVPRASFPLYLGRNWVAIKRHPLGRLFFSSDQPGAGDFTIDGLPGDHKGRCFFVFWRRDGDCLLRLIGLVRFIDPGGREIAARSLLPLTPVIRPDLFESDKVDPLQRIRNLLKVGDTGYIETLIHREIGA